MVNKQQYINEEEFYQQIMAELEPGAAEYDRMMANGENPASKAKKVPLGRKWYAVAACFIGLLIIGITYKLYNDSEGQVADVTSVAVPKNIEPMTAHAIDNNIGSASFVNAQNAPKRKESQKVAKEKEDYIYMFQEIEITPSDEEMTEVVLPAPERQRSFDITCINLLPDATEGGNADVMVICDRIYFNDIQTFY